MVTMMSTLADYRPVNKGSGAILLVGDIDSPFVGVMGCESSVGIYFKIDAQKSFCAHVKCISAIGEEVLEPSDEQVKSLREQIVNKLIHIAAKGEWKLDNGKLGSNIVTVCRKPYSNGPDGLRLYLGWRIVQALGDFFVHAARTIAQGKYVFPVDEPLWSPTSAPILPMPALDGIVSFHMLNNEGQLEENRWEQFTTASGTFMKFHAPGDDNAALPFTVSRANAKRDLRRQLRRNHPRTSKVRRPSRREFNRSLGLSARIRKEVEGLTLLSSSSMGMCCDYSGFIADTAQPRGGILLQRATGGFIDSINKQEVDSNAIALDESLGEEEWCIYL